MNNQVSYAPSCILAIAGLAVLSLTTACRTGSSDVLAHSSTLIGVDISQSTSTQMPKVKAGYGREELAIVPTNRRNSAGSNSANELEKHYKNGARDSANVIMELRGAGLIESMSFGGNIYQRLAVGDTAVRQPGASLMLARDKTGNLGEKQAAEVAKAAKARATYSGELLENERKGADLFSSLDAGVQNAPSGDLEAIATAAIESRIIDQDEWDQIKNDTTLNTDKKEAAKRKLLKDAIEFQSDTPGGVSKLTKLQERLKGKLPTISW